MKNALRIGAISLVATLSVAGATLATILGFESGLDRLWPLSWISFPIVGWLILLRRPGNRIGRIMLALGGMTFLVAAEPLLDRLAVANLIRAWVFWTGTWWAPVVFGLIPLLLLWYPTGNPPSQRWRRPTHIYAGLLATVSIHYAFRPGPLIDLATENPVGIGPLAGLRDGPVEEAAGFALLAFGLCALASLVNRWHRAQAMERQQLKWLAAGGMTFVILFLVAVVIGETPVGLVVSAGAWVLGLNSMGVAVGIAIFRYRLYEIDRIISRTVSYGVVATLLVATYAGGVFLIQAILPASGDLAIAASTLAVAALFNPLRRRTQRWVERRFNRGRYNAEREVEAFSGRLTTEVGLGAVTADLTGVVARTVQPATATVWIREAT